MRRVMTNTNGTWQHFIFAGLACALALALPLALHADKKKKAEAAAANEAKIKSIDYSNIVWPNPPAIARIKYKMWYSSDKEVRNMKGNVQKKSAWMDRLAGTQSSEEVFKRPFELNQPYGCSRRFPRESLHRGPESGRDLYLLDRRN